MLTGLSWKSKVSIGYSMELTHLTSTSSIFGFCTGVTTSFGADLPLRPFLSIEFTRLTELTEQEVAAVSSVFVSGELDVELSGSSTVLEMRLPIEGRRELLTTALLV